MNLIEDKIGSVLELIAQEKKSFKQDPNSVDSKTTVNKTYLMELNILCTAMTPSFKQRISLQNGNKRSLPILDLTEFRI